MRYFVTFPSGTEIPVDVELLPTGAMNVMVGGRRIEAETLAQAGSTAMKVDHRVVDLWMEGVPPEVGVVARGQRFYARVESDRMRALAALGARAPTGGAGMVTSPMPGRVLKLLVAEGDEVAAGASLVVVEAMKMENELSAARAGKVLKVFVVAGQKVESGARLVEIG
jgi:glutaconyl-CoA/methylmalonyl-CoA decarboxylase subunit gamma